MTNQIKVASLLSTRRHRRSSSIREHTHSSRSRRFIISSLHNKSIPKHMVATINSRWESYSSRRLVLEIKHGFRTRRAKGSGWLETRDPLSSLLKLPPIIRRKRIGSSATHQYSSNSFPSVISIDFNPIRKKEAVLIRKSGRLQQSWREPQLGLASILIGPKIFIAIA